MAQILVNSTNTIYTTSFTTTAKTITLAGENNFPLDINSLDSVYDVTAGAIFNLTNLQFTWYRANNLPIYTWIFNTIPAGAASGDTLNLLLNVPQNLEQFILQQKQASGSAGSPGTFVGGETPTGAINGTNKTFTLAFTPNGGICLTLTPSGGVPQLLNNVPQMSSYQPEDYNISGNTITFLVAPPTGSTIYANYYH